MENLERFAATWRSLLPLLLVLLPLMSLLVAHAAGQGRSGSWAWGIFGPIGWVIAAILGASERNTTNLEQLRTQLRRTAREPSTSQE